MSVLKGEGKVPILFGTTSVARGPLTHTAYLARPDLAGEWQEMAGIAFPENRTPRAANTCPMKK